ncbi:CLUMA_CG019710, isoform A [Clunio marinus]|uniref:CLUMA_CG019710, isoform A n=1 Tax=Clunio marinus TaxID=568069 RepID=A0A1J1J280_9DIPT|nr:CLUMA_CG019710, isoform A [Clunio marinus]
MPLEVMQPNFHHFIRIEKICSIQGYYMFSSIIPFDFSTAKQRYVNDKNMLLISMYAKEKARYLRYELLMLSFPTVCYVYDDDDDDDG